MTSLRAIAALTDGVGKKDTARANVPRPLEARRATTAG